jgi:hypothetical protein
MVVKDGGGHGFLIIMATGIKALWASNLQRGDLC